RGRRPGKVMKGTVLINIPVSLNAAPNLTSLCFLSFSRPIFPKMFSRYKRLLLVFAFLALLWGIFQFSGLRDNFNLAFLHRQFVDNAFTGLLVFIVLFALGNLIQIPGLIFLAAAVISLDRFWGGLATYLAAIVSCVFTFWLIRLIGDDSLRLIKNRYAIRLLNNLDKRPAWTTFFLRLLLQTAPALNYALAMSGIRFKSYLIGTLLGLPIPIALYCLFFDYLATVLHLTGH
ncbi:MAG: VTT domain-containing protein, partial [Polaromonas sp.]